eukprot:c16442_g1_i1 orf=375-845(+)
MFCSYFYKKLYNGLESSHNQKQATPITSRNKGNPGAEVVTVEPSTTLSTLSPITLLLKGEGMRRVPSAKTRSGFEVGLSWVRVVREDFSDGNPEEEFLGLDPTELPEALLLNKARDLLAVGALGLDGLEEMVGAVLLLLHPEVACALNKPYLLYVL